MLTLWNGLDRSWANELRRMNRVFDDHDVFRSPTPAAAFPTVDLEEIEQAYVLTADVPGFTADDVQLTLHDGTLELKGEQKSSKEEKDDKRVVYRERRKLSFSRTFKLGAQIDHQGVSASVKDGVLTVTLLKKPEAQPRQIVVKAS